MPVKTQEGIKYDDKKPRIAEMLLDFAEPMEALCRVWEFGANKYAKSNWKYVDNAKDRYTNAMLRHLMAEQDSAYDGESTLLHAAHVAWNAMARLAFILQEPISEADAAWLEKARDLANKPEQACVSESDTLPKQLKLPLEGVDQEPVRYTYGTRCE